MNQCGPMNPGAAAGRESLPRARGWMFLGQALLLGGALSLAAPLPAAQQGDDGRPFMERMQALKQAMPDKASRPDGLAITVLGSGGPMAMSERASAGYVIYINKVPRIMMDGGGGVYERMGKGHIFDLLRLDTWLLSHLHIDHSADFPAIVKSMYFLRRGYNQKTPLLVVGPEAWGHFPSTKQFVADYFDPDKGTYRYLHDFLDTVLAKDMQIETKEVPYDYEKVKSPVEVLEKDGIRITSIPVMHGPREAKTPSVAYRIDYKGRSITYSGDLNLHTDNLITLAKGTDVLIVDASLGPAQKFEPPSLYHPLPDDIGKAAKAAGAKKLVLSHFMPPYIPAKIDRIVEAVKQHYDGPVVVAEDLMTIAADGSVEKSGGQEAEDDDGRDRSGPMQRMRERRQQRSE